jgi:hypothetical protein
VTATKTRKKQQKELVRDALAAEHEKLRTERENFRLHSVSVNQRAAYEPSLFHAAAEDHEEGTVINTERFKIGSHKYRVY